MCVNHYHKDVIQWKQKQILSTSSLQPISHPQMVKFLHTPPSFVDITNMGHIHISQLFNLTKGAKSSIYHVTWPLHIFSQRYAYFDVFPFKYIVQYQNLCKKNTPRNLFHGCVPNFRIWVFCPIFKNIESLLVLYLGSYISYSHNLYIWSDRKYPTVRF